MVILLWLMILNDEIFMDHAAPVASQPEVTPAANLNRIGTSSEWSGTSELVADSFERETKPWVRSKVSVLCSCNLRHRDTLNLLVFFLAEPESKNDFHR